MNQAANFATCSSENLVEFQRTTWCYITDDTIHYSLFIFVKFEFESCLNYIAIFVSNFLKIPK
jgi:hypothetical protein